MPRSSSFVVLALALASACNKPDPAPAPLNVKSSGGLPGAFDGGPPAPGTWFPDAAPPVPDVAAAGDLAGDQAVADAAPDSAAAAADAAVDASATVLTDADVCSSTTATAKPLPVDIFVLLDRSSSMDTEVIGARTDAGTYLTRWTSIRQALGQFVTSPAAAGLEVGLGYFPPDLYDYCDVASYAKPAVPVDALPGVATPFLASIDMTFPNGGTPTLPALQGAYQYAHEREMTMNRRTVIALATDGEPNDCGSSLPAVQDAAAMAASHGIYTFVIGVGEDVPALNGLAIAGGTKTAFLANSATPDELANAFKAVQSQAAKLACTFSVPPAPPGQMLDTDRSMVHFLPASGTTGFDIPMVTGHAACTLAGGWYVDDLFAPKTLTLCEASCQQVNGAGDGSVTVQFACRAK
jgi:hypothetical protein